MSITIEDHPNRNHTDGSLKDRCRGFQMRQMERIEAYTQDLNDYFGDDSHGLVTLTMEVNDADLLMAARALPALLPGWRVEREVAYDWRRPALLERHAVEIAPERFDFVIQDGRQFWRCTETDERLCVEYEVDDDPREPDSEVRLTAPSRRHDWLVALVPRIRAHIDEHHFLRGQAIDGNYKLLRFGEVTRWEDVLIPLAVRQAIEDNVINLLRHSAFYAGNGVPLKRGLILHGPPGTGKTMIGRALSQSVPATFILVTPGMLKELHDVRRIFTLARRLAPSILFFEDFDLVASRRGGEGSRGLLGEFLSCLDGLDAQQGVVTIATTNDLGAIEPALKDRPNRFDVILEVPPLEFDDRLALLRRRLAGHPLRVNLRALAVRMGRLTGAQVQEVCRLAVLAAVNEAIAQGDLEVRRIPLLRRHFLTALESLPTKTIRPIGFHGWSAVHDADWDEDGYDEACDDIELDEQGA